MDALQNYIDGGWRASVSDCVIRRFSPVTEELVAVLPCGDEADVNDAVASSRRAAPEWAARSLYERLKSLEMIADAVSENLNEIARLESVEMGRPASVGRPWLEGGVSRFRSHIELARKFPFAERTDDSSGCTTTVVRRPLGVAALIVPWNFQTTAIMGAIGALLATGNCVVLKPSEKTALSAGRLMELFNIPPGVVNMVLGDSRAGAPLAAHHGVDYVHFTGSVPAGRAIAVAAANKLHRSTLELGGKDAAVVDADVDVVSVAMDVARGSFANSGQICTSMERIYVHREVAEEFIEALTNEASRYICGHPSDPTARLGPLVDGDQMRIVAEQVADALASGAHAVTGGSRLDRPGFYYPATVLTGVSGEMRLMQDETFGPIAPIEVVDSFEEGLAKAAEGRFGLAATVYSNNLSNIERASSLPVGILWINRWQGRSAVVVREPYGESGMGSGGHFATLEAATRPQSVVKSPGWALSGLAM